jgi:hypothetical protein
MNVANQPPDDDPNGHIPPAPPADDASAGTNSSIAEESQPSDSDLETDDGSGSDTASPYRRGYLKQKAVAKCFTKTVTVKTAFITRLKNQKDSTSVNWGGREERGTKISWIF